MNPKIEIYYSDIYQAFIRDLQKKGFAGYEARKKSGWKFAKNLSTKTKFLLPKALKAYENVSGLKWKNKISQKYRKEHFVVLEHILPHAILWKAYEKLFGPKKLQNIIKGYTRWKWHYRAWQIVKEEGADN